MRSLASIQMDFQREVQGDWSGVNAGGDELVRAYRALREELRTTPTARVFCERTGHTSREIEMAFGTFAELRRAAGPSERAMVFDLNYRGELRGHNATRVYIDESIHFEYTALMEPSTICVQPTIEQLREEGKKHTPADFARWCGERTRNFTHDTLALITMVLAEANAPALVEGQTGLEPDIVSSKRPYAPYVEPTPEKSIRVDFVAGEIVFRSMS